MDGSLLLGQSWRWPADANLHLEQEPPLTCSQQPSQSDWWRPHHCLRHWGWAELGHLVTL